MTKLAPIRLPFWRGVFYAFMALGIVLTTVRFTQGLGSVSNLSDQFPCGLWVGFDLLCGVGLASGGFVVTAAIQHKISFPLVVVGVVLSTLHQSSLGTLYLIVPGKLHALWYTPLLPVLFLVSSIIVGLAMVIVESRLSSRAFGRQLEMPLLMTIGHILAGLLVMLTGLRFFDLWNRGELATLFAFDYESKLALLELVPFMILPTFLLATPRLRANPSWLYGSAVLVVLGFVVNRLNVSITGMEAASGGHYVPSWAEAGITMFIIVLGFGVFAWAAKHLPVFPTEKEEDDLLFEALEPLSPAHGTREEAPLAKA